MNATSNRLRKVKQAIKQRTQTHHSHITFSNTLTKVRVLLKVRWLLLVVALRLCNYLLHADSKTSLTLTHQNPCQQWDRPLGTLPPLRHRDKHCAPFVVALPYFSRSYESQKPWVPDAGVLASPCGAERLRRVRHRLSCHLVLWLWASVLCLGPS